MAKPTNAPIEQWLGWAFREELPRLGSGTVASGVGSTSWGGMAGLAELGTLIDRTNHFGCVVDHSAERDPHPDAVTIGNAVLALRDVRFDAPEGYDLLGDIVLADATLPSAEEKTETMARGIGRAGLGHGRMPGNVIRFAMLGVAPAWERPKVVTRRIVNGAQGRPAWFRKVERCDGDGRPTFLVEVDGYDPIRKRPHRNAYRKHALVPDLGWIVAERAEYQAYVLALAELAAGLDGRLDGGVDAPELPLWPWETSAHHEAPKLSGTGDDAHPRASMAA